jgi:hypothetical protein
VDRKTRKFKAVRGAEQIGVNDVVGIAAIAGVHARLGGCFDKDVGRARAGKIVHAADIALHELHAASSQAWQRQLAAAALEIVKGNHRRGRPVALERKREIGPDETGPAGNEDAFNHDEAAM